MNRPSVLILAPDAEEYLPLLDGLSRQGTRLCAASSPDRVRAVWEDMIDTMEAMPA